MIKLLTGKTLHEAFNYTSVWHSLPDQVKVRYEEIAKDLNEKLGLCANCGERPADGELLEVCGDMVCNTCCNPPLQGEQGAQWIWAMFNERGEIADVVELPADMTYEEYSKQLKEEMSHYRFTLSFPGPEGIEIMSARTLPELHTLMSEHLHEPSDSLGYSYTIGVFKDTEVVGTGTYKCIPVGMTQIVNEEGLAVGLHDLLLEYEFEHA